MAQESATRACPYCKEEIKADAIRCKHCRSTVEPETPAHGGICPYCKEAIHAEAAKCKHCGANLRAVSGGCAGCAHSYEDGEPISAAARRLPGFPGFLDQSVAGILAQLSDVRSHYVHCRIEPRPCFVKDSRTGLAGVGIKWVQVCRGSIGGGTYTSEQELTGCSLG